MVAVMDRLGGNRVFEKKKKKTAVFFFFFFNLDSLFIFSFPSRIQIILVVYSEETGKGREMMVESEKQLPSMEKKGVQK